MEGFTQKGVCLEDLKEGIHKLAKSHLHHFAIKHEALRRNNWTKTNTILEVIPE